MRRQNFQRAALAVAGLTLTTGLAFARAATEDTPVANDNQCVFFRTVYDWKALDRRHLLIWAPGRHDPYEVELSTPLDSLRFADRLAFVDRNGDGRLCGFGMDRVIVPDTPLREDATIVGLTRLDARSLAAVADQYGVKLPASRVAEAGPDSGNAKQVE